MGTLRSALIATACAFLLGRVALAGESDSPLKRIRDLEAAVAALADRVAALEGTTQRPAAPTAPEATAQPDAVQRLRDLEAAVKSLGSRVTALERGAPTTPPKAATRAPAGVVDGRLQGIPPAKDYGRRHFIQREYDKFSDSTSFTLKLPLRSNRNAEIRLTAFWASSGQNPRYAPRQIALMFTRNQAEWQWLEYHKIQMLTSGGARYSADGSHSGDTVNSGVIEHVTVRVDVVQFLDIVNSAELDVRVGLDDIHVSGYQIDALRDLASRIPAEVSTDGTK